MIIILGPLALLFVICIAMVYVAVLVAGFAALIPPYLMGMIAGKMIDGPHKFIATMFLVGAFGFPIWLSFQVGNCLPLIGIVGALMGLGVAGKKSVNAT